MLNGRQAGKKVVVIKQLDEGTKDRPYPYAVVAGIERYPLKVTKAMSDKKIKSRSRVKPFIKVRSTYISSWLLIKAYHIYQIVNYSHLFPTRYALELEGLKGAVTIDTFKEPSQRADAKKAIRKLLQDRYYSGKNRWFFQKLRVSRPLLPHDGRC